MSNAVIEIPTVELLTLPSLPDRQANLDWFRATQADEPAETYETDDSEEFDTPEPEPEMPERAEPENTYGRFYGC